MSDAAASPLADRVTVLADVLVGEILSDRWAAGACLPPEDELARTHAVDRETVRLALRDLRGLNLVTLAPDGAAVVRDWRVAAELTVLPHYFRHAAASREKIDVAADVLRVRRIVLAEAASRAAERATPADLASLRELVDSMRDCRGDSPNLLLLDRRFLGRLVDATHSPIFRWTANSFFHVYDDVLRVVPDIWSLPQDHFTFLDELMVTLAAHDPEETAVVVLRHMERTDPLVLALIRLRLEA